MAAACASDPGPDAGAAGDATVADAGSSDAEAPDAETVDGSAPYTYVAPPTTPAPEFLQAERWKTHFADDLRPYWMLPDAFGQPEGNFPSLRDMTGRAIPGGVRHPRMIARQTFAYAMGFALTGEPRLIELAHAGMRWLAERARDPRGGCHARLDATGAPIEDVKTAQDLEYCALGFAAYHFAARDPAAERELFALRDLLFDPTKYWDAENQRIRDAMSADLTREVDVEGDGGWELVAQLDAMNGFLLLAQPVLSTPERRAQFLGDLETLGQSLVRHFWSAGIFWGVHNAKGRYLTKHVDFGHTLKSYWMLRETDKRLPGNPFRLLLEAEARRMLDRAYDRPNGRWAKRPSDETSVEYGSDWWQYAEADQLAASLDMGGGALEDVRAETQKRWVQDYVDRTRPAREVVPSIRRNGQWVFGWRDTDTAKCNEWKSGFHSVEHALVAYLAGAWREGTPAALHFAIPRADVDTFVARPYVFQGTELDRAVVGTATVGGEARAIVRVRFERLY